MTDTFSMTISGKNVSGSESFDVVNPATEEVFATAPNCTQQELERAISAAESALPNWRGTTLDERRNVMNAMAGKIAENAETLARLLIKEQGKPYEAAMADVMGGAHWLVETAKMDIKDEVVEDSEQRYHVTKYEPIGVVAAIVPWNFPVVLAMFKVAPALLAGNTIVLKPSPTTPLTTLKIGELVSDLVPAGVLNVISGDNRLGPWMTAHPAFNKISFTGSTQTGKKVMESAAKDLKKITLELGGNDAAIVMPDINVEKVAEQLFWAAFQNTGQICIATKRMYVHKDIYEPLKEALVAYAKTVKVGDGAEQGTTIGPIQNKAQYQRVLDLIQDAKDQGYKFLVGGETSSAPGYFVPVTILDNPPEDARIVQEEQFGPVLPLMSFENLDEVVTRANDTQYGLGASVWSADIEAAKGLADSLEAGTVWINETQYLTPHAAFGGAKHSGIGAEGGAHGVYEFCQPKTISIRRDAAFV